MKAIKLLSVAFAMAFAMNANAQFTSSGGTKSGGSKNYASFEPESHWTGGLKVGSVGGTGGFGAGFGYQKSIYGYQGWTLAWDVFNLDWSAPFNSPADMDMLSLKTGLRVFTPSFANDKFRLYANLAMGYTCVLSKGSGASGLFAKFAEFGLDDDRMEDWMEDNGYSDREIYDFFDQFDDFEEAFDGSYGGDKYENYKAYRQALMDQMSGGGSMTANHAFGLTFGAGVQINKKFSLGYSLEYETAFKSKSHFATFGVSF